MKEAKELLKKYQSGNCTKEELALLHRWIHDIGKDDISTITESELIISKLNFDKKFKQNISRQHRNKKLYQYTTAAAILTFLIGFSIYKYTYTDKSIPTTLTNQDTVEDVAPGRDLATLTLANGKKVLLDSLTNNKIIEINNQHITKTKEGELIYKTTDSNTKESIAYNTLETPLKGKYKITLPDGSGVWINSLSTLRFPNRFSENSREVELLGEAYFEIQHDSKKSFIVKSKNQKVIVLGTHFNIKNYNDEPSTQTTLIEGSVKVISNSDLSTRELKPGQQSVLQNNKLVVRKVNINQILDWKNDDFIFEQENLAHIMKRVSRWYGVNVSYQKGIDLTQTFSGQVSRTKNLSEVLKILSTSSDLDFRINNNQIIIKQKL